LSIHFYAFLALLQVSGEEKEEGKVRKERKRGEGKALAALLLDSCRSTQEGERGKEERARDICGKRKEEKIKGENKYVLIPTK